MPCAPPPCIMLQAAFGGVLPAERTTPRPDSQGSQTPGGSTFPVWFQTLLFGVMLLHLAEQRQIHQRKQPSLTFCPNSAGEDKLHRGRAGLHPKPTETSGETRNDFSSSHLLSLSVLFELKSFAGRKKQTNPNAAAAAASEPRWSLTQANPSLFSSSSRPLKLGYFTEAARGARGCLCHPVKLLV